MHPVPHGESQPFAQEGQASGDPFPHTGKDYKCPAGTPVKTIADGVVIFVGWDLPDHLADRFMMVRGSDASGLHAIIEHDGWVELMAHCQDALVGPGARVRRGQDVMVSGNTGRTTAAHLHYETILEPCTGSFPFGRYNPDLQVMLEDSLETIKTQPKQPEGSPMTQAELNAIQAMHDVTRQFVVDKVQEMHNVTRKYIVDRTQDQQDVTREYIPDRVSEDMHAAK